MAALAGGILADRLGGPTAMAIAGVVGVACALIYLRRQAADAASAPMVYSARESIRALRARPMLNRAALAQGFYGGGFIAAGPLFALVYVDRLNLSLADVGVIGVLSAVATTLSFLVWGVISDRFGGLAADAVREPHRSRWAHLLCDRPGRRAPVVLGGRDRDQQLIDRGRDRLAHQR